MWRFLSCFRFAVVCAALVLTGAFVVPRAAFAATGTTATIEGTVKDAAGGAPLAGVKVAAVSPSQVANTVTDAHGFYVFNGLSADTYTISFQLEGYDAATLPGVTAAQGETATSNVSLGKTTKTIARVSARSSGNLVQPNNGSDVYNVNGAQAAAATGANNNSQTLYTYLGTVPGVTVSGGVGAPRIRGGDTHDIGYEFDGIPIRERLFGLFTSDLTDVGIGNTEVYTGGLPASSAGSGAGVINTVAKVGTYPAHGEVTVGATTPDYNHYLTVEYGGQTSDRKFSYYGAFGGVASRNVYNYGLTSYPNLIGSDVAGPVNERDVVANFHYRPSQKDDFQFLIQNGLGDFVYDYDQPGKGQPHALSITPCAGYSTTAPGASASNFGAIGGTAPDGEPCPAGFAWSDIPGNANSWHHYSGLGKIQWNHTINGNSFFDLRLAENYNEYIFDQPLADPNLPALENPGGYLNISADCPLYPYTPGTPVAVSPSGATCAYDDQSFYGDRKSHMYFLSADYTNSINSNVTIRAGAGQEYDENLLQYVGRDSFNLNGTYPNVNYAYSDVPTHVPDVYVSADVRLKKLLLTPGLYWSRINYGIPALLGGTRSTGLYNPTFNGTYTFDPRNALRFSYGNASSFIGSAYIARTYPVGPNGVPVPVPAPASNPHANPYDPGDDGASIAPELVQSGDLMYEHDFGDNTSMRFGPYYNNSIGYYESYRPVLGFTNGTPKLGPAVNSSSGRHHTFGFEFALNHVDARPVGLSYWLTATYDNYWSTSAASLTGASPVFVPLPSYFTSRGILVRNSSNPLVDSALVLDYHSHRFHWYPELFYNLDTFYNVGYTQPKTGPPVLTKNGIAGAWYLANMTFSEDLTHNLTLGVTARNITNQGNGPAPCFVVDATGCAGVNGPYSGLSNQVPGSYIYQQVPNYFSPYPQSFELFLTAKI